MAGSGIDLADARVPWRHPGAYAGRAVVRHKTRKQPFSSHLFQILVLQVLALGGVIGWWFIR